MEKKDESELIRKRIDYFLKDKNMSLNQLANKSNIAYSTIFGIMNKNNIPSLTNIRKISEGLGISTIKLLNIEPYNQPSEATYEDYLREVNPLYGIVEEMREIKEEIQKLKKGN